LFPDAGMNIPENQLRPTALLFTTVMIGIWKILLLVGLGFTLAASAVERGFKAEFLGGTLPGLQAKSSARIDFTNADALAFRCTKQSLSIAYARINTLEYGQHVSRRVAAAVLLSPVLLLSKSRQHFVTIGFTDADGKQQALVFRLEKGDIRSVLASLEARTGRRVEFQDDEARKAGQ
jgi:hypothetical protein